MSGICIRDWSGAAEVWDAYVHSAPEGTVCHLYGWREVIERAYRHQTFYLAAMRQGRICGLLPLALIRSRLFGRHLVSMPYMDYGGVVTQDGEEVRQQLVEAATQLAHDSQATLCLRCGTDQGLALPVWLDKLTMRINLGTDVDALWKWLSPERRNRIRKGHKHGLKVSFHASEHLEAFYRIFATNMRDLGSPVHSRQFFHRMFASLEPYLRLILVWHQDTPIAAACCLFYQDTVTIPGWISALRPYFSLCPNQVLHWELMRYGIDHGYRTLDLGRSSKDTGTFEAKRQWRATPVQLYWYYFPDVPPSQRTPQPFSRQVALWQRLPVSLANAVGPSLRKSIPN
ncbi:MAG: hypothetical protein ETSY1_05860 [Candidatus Entotheonella factor]|uniref:BioF2-like acetyltransferase domain-containing protein n=1 Tax=Entotheonella factor TaxID=1429438 RepID=W4LVD8_ENTF1|nr:FemAB family XrtA/PEP-CTERM system-associated protein [Candidatus Entotheonella palauensis]ETX01855.1 MAG: hypothetical protein ETSY1_05860 [Candidatus Entotheonella factor]